jgi:hypothetical protein
MNALARLEFVSQKLAECTDLGELRQIHDLAEAARSYARAHALGDAAARHALRVKLEAGMRLAELCPAVSRRETGRGHVKSSPGEDFLPAPRLSEYRRLLEVGTDRVWAWLAEGLEIKAMVRQARLEVRRPAPEPPPAPPQPHVSHNVLDALATFGRLDETERRHFLWFAGLAETEVLNTTRDVSWQAAVGFAILGLPDSATESDVRRAQKEAARVAHPDRGGTQKAFARITQAARDVLEWFAEKV